MLKFVSNIEECCEFLPPEADLTLCFALYLRKLNCPIQPHPISRDFSLTLQEAIDCSIIMSVKAKPWLDQDRFLSIRVGRNKEKIIPREPMVLLLSEVCL